jgi:aminopeptidase YwaD
MRKKVFIIGVIVAVAAIIPLYGEKRGGELPPILIPEKLVQIILNEVSGEIPFDNEVMLAGINHNRPSSEYLNHFYESEYMLKKLKEYGVEAWIEKLPPTFKGSKTWDAVSAELWMVEPKLVKLTSLEDVPACLAPGSCSADVKAELVYVGPGDREEFYQGKEIAGKLILVDGFLHFAIKLGITKYKAAGIICFSSSHPEYDPDEVGWNYIGGWGMRGGTSNNFAFVISYRMGNELRRMLERGVKIRLHATCETESYPENNEVVVALIKGSEKPDEELWFTAHLFEGFAKQGANDNISGSVAILEVARTITRLVREGKIPPPKRSIRFLWINEFMGTIPYIVKHPDLLARAYAVINEDMVGEGLGKNNALFRVKCTPWSCPSFLNDVVANMTEYVGMTNRDDLDSRYYGSGGFINPILSARGSRDTFYYSIDRHFGSSDHAVFVDGGVRIPAVMLIVWPDMWYHTDRDRPDKSDSTQFKRVCFISTASALYMAEAGENEGLTLASYIFSKGNSRLGEDMKRAVMLIGKSKKDELSENYKEAKNIVHQSFLREEETLSSVSFFASENGPLSSLIESLKKQLTAREKIAQNDLLLIYRSLAAKFEVKPLLPKLTAQEKEAAELIPKRTKDFQGYFNSFLFSMRLRKEAEIILPRFTLFEVRNFIDGKRSILDIKNAVSAEYQPVSLAEVAKYIRLLEKAGFVTF